MKNVKKSILVAGMGALTLGAPANAKSGKNTDKVKDTASVVNAAARRTVGTIVKYETVPSLMPDMNIIGYHIDEDGDGRADVVRYRMVGVNQPHVMHSPFAIVEVIETYDEKNHVWNITAENVVGTQKLKNPPVYTPNNKSR